MNVKDKKEQATRVDAMIRTAKIKDNGWEDTLAHVWCTHGLVVLDTIIFILFVAMGGSGTKEDERWRSLHEGEMYSRPS